MSKKSYLPYILTLAFCTMVYISMPGMGIIGIGIFSFVMLILTFYAKGGGKRGAKQFSTAAEKSMGIKRANEEYNLTKREKKLLIYHILCRVEKAQTIDMSDLAEELNVSIYALADLIKFMDKHNVLKVIYLPLKSFPVLRRGDEEASTKYKEMILHDLAKKTVAAPNMDEFSKEVDAYLDALRRR